MTDRQLLERDLDEFVEGDTWPVPDEGGEPLPLKDEAQVAGVLRRLKALDREAQTIADVAKGEIERIAQWRDDRLGGIDKERAYGERAVEAFHRRHVATTPGARKSLSLPDGTLKLAKAQEKLDVVDEEAFLAWAVTTTKDERVHVYEVTQPALVRVHIEPDKAAIKTLPRGFQQAGEEGADQVRTEVVTPDGEIVPGVQIVRPAYDRFNVKLTDD